MENKKIKVGVIGTGNISHEHIKSYIANPNVELYAFCDINPVQLKKMADLYGVERTFTDINEFLKLDEIDAVSVCTWNSAHAPCTIAALNAGKHVLCEKPMATSAAEAREMLAAAEKNTLEKSTTLRLPICVETAIPEVGLATNPVPPAARSLIWASMLST